MTIRTVKFITNDDEKLITSSDIASKEDYHENFQGHLYCAEEDCNAVIVYVDEKPPFFRTWPNSEHNINCIYHTTKEKTRPSSRNGEQRVASLTPEQIKHKLLGAYNKYNPNPNPKPRSPRKNIDKPIKLKTGDNVSYQIDPNAPPIENLNIVSRSKIKKCEDISDFDIDNPITLYCFINSIDILEDEVLFNLKCENSNKVVLQFYNAFKQNSLQDWNNLKYIKEYLEKNNKRINIICHANVKKIEDKYILQIMSSDLMLINTRSFSSFIYRITNYTL